MCLDPGGCHANLAIFEEAGKGIPLIQRVAHRPCGWAVRPTDEEAARIKGFGWQARRLHRGCLRTVYSALSIDWTKRITHTPSGSDFVCVDPAAGQSVVNFREIAELFA